MANKLLPQSQSLLPTDTTLFVDIGDGVLARVEGAVAMVGNALASVSNPVPVELTSASEDQALLVDDITGALATIPVVHHEVHEGDTFQVSYKSPDDTPIADDGNMDILLQTGARYAHLVFDIRAGGPAEVLFYEDTEVSDAGTAMTEHNMKRYSETAATVTATYTPTVTGAGTLLHDSLLPGGTGAGKSRTGGTVRDNTEWILKLNSNYLIRGTNRAGNAQPMSNIAQWYEESTG